MKNKIGGKLHKKCEEIANKKYSSCWVSGHYPHYQAECWLSRQDADWVDYKEKEVLDVIKITNQNMVSLIEKEFKLEFNVPLLLEAKIGTNWLDTKDVT